MTLNCDCSAQLLNLLTIVVQNLFYEKLQIILEAICVHIEILLDTLFQYLA